MIDEGTIHCNQPKAFDMALGEQQPVKRVAGGWFGVKGVEDVCNFNAQQV